jgi:predicted NACHT family NTPase
MTELDDLVQRVRESRQDKIRKQCGTMRMLDIAQAVDLSEQYVDVYVLKDRPSQQYQDISKLIYIAIGKVIRTLSAKRVPLHLADTQTEPDACECGF